MAYNPATYTTCPECGKRMKKGHYLCNKCSYIPIPPPPPLHPEFLQYDKGRKCNCEKCGYEWLCRIWVFYLGLWALCEIPSETDLMLLRQNGRPI
jgi:hypothetical protein